jgi:hypothetical protein
MAVEFTVTFGSGLTVTGIVPVPTQPLASVTVAEYVPLAAVVAGFIVGFCEAEVNPLGPDQFQVTPLEQVKFNAAPSQMGELLASNGIRLAFTVTVVVAVAVQEFNVTVTV